MLSASLLTNKIKSDIDGSLVIPVKLSNHLYNRTWRCVRPDKFLKDLMVTYPASERANIPTSRCDPDFSRRFTADHVESNPGKIFAVLNDMSSLNRERRPRCLIEVRAPFVVRALAQCHLTLSSSCLPLGRRGCALGYLGLPDRDSGSADRDHSSYARNPGLCRPTTHILNQLPHNTSVMASPRGADAAGALVAQAGDS